jgi:hypothetical protein
MQRLARTWFPRLALVAVLALASLVAVSGNTQARYVSDTAQTSDSARVAKWGTLTVNSSSSNRLVLDEAEDGDGNAWTVTYDFTVTDTGNEVATAYDVELSGLFSSLDITATLYKVGPDDTNVLVSTQKTASGSKVLTFENVGMFAPGGGSQEFVLTLSIDKASVNAMTSVTVSANARQVD